LLLVLLVGFLALVAASGWLAWRTFAATPICDIINSPREFEGRQVTVEGEVTGRLGVLSFNSFTVKDETGELRVLTRSAPPGEGRRVRVHGRVQLGLALGNWQHIMLIERN
jgi:hypothetical protein